LTTIAQLPPLGEDGDSPGGDRSRDCVAIEQSAEVDVNEIVVRPTAQT